MEIEVNDEEMFWCSAWIGLADLADLDLLHLIGRESLGIDQEILRLQFCMTRNPPLLSPSVLQFTKASKMSMSTSVSALQPVLNTNGF